MSVANVLSALLASGKAPFLVVAVLVIAIVVTRGYRWVSQPDLSTEARRMVRGVVFAGWGVVFAIIAAGIFLAALNRDPATEREASNQPPAMRTVPYDRPEADRSARLEPL